MNSLKKYVMIICLTLSVNSMLNACSFKATDPSVIRMEDALEDYDYMWKILETNYPFFPLIERKYHIAIDALKSNYRNEIQELNQNIIRFDDYYEILQMCIDSMHQTGHLSIISPDYYQKELSKESAYRNTGIWDARLKWQYELYEDPEVKARYQYLQTEFSDNTKGSANSILIEENSPNITFNEYGEGIAYVKIKSFNASYIDADKEKLNAWFKNNLEKKLSLILPKTVEEPIATGRI